MMISQPVLLKNKSSHCEKKEKKTIILTVIILHIVQKNVVSSVFRDISPRFFMKCPPPILTKLSLYIRYL